MRLRAHLPATRVWTLHNPEFTTIEPYESYADFTMRWILRRVSSPPPPRISWQLSGGVAGRDHRPDPWMVRLTMIDAVKQYVAWTSTPSATMRPPAAPPRLWASIWRGVSAPGDRSS